MPHPMITEGFDKPMHFYLNCDVNDESEFLWHLYTHTDPSQWREGLLQITEEEYDYLADLLDTGVVDRDLWIACDDRYEETIHSADEISEYSRFIIRMLLRRYNLERIFDARNIL
jgi:hypothetical protein